MENDKTPKILINPEAKLKIKRKNGAIMTYRTSENNSKRKGQEAKRTPQNGKSLVQKSRWKC